MNFTNSITKHITKLVGTLKNEDELQEILKRKFTKREYKTFIAFEEGKDIDEIKTLLKEDDEKEVEKIYQTAIKKLNQEIFKRELVDL
ncbi:hypothetical protein [Aliarcobacter cryaerophilus]|uniref:hypothetical protein n=1 Tax=Aliarcobacter cryaerophilus TaxID=28198 RepID=UPI003DA25081